MPLNPLPLRVDRAEAARADRRSVVRACTAMAATAAKGIQAAPEFMRRSWPTDVKAEHIVKSAIPPFDTSSMWAIQSSSIIPTLAPSAASTRLLAMGNVLSLDGIATIKVPYIGGSGRPRTPPFTGEGAVFPIYNLSVGGPTLGPTRAVKIGAAITNELQAASAGAAEQIVGRALQISCTQAFDSVLFDSNPASSTRPAGILNTKVAITAATGGGIAAAAADLAAIADQIAQAGVDSSDMVIICAPTLAMKLKVLMGPKFDNTVLASPFLSAANQIIGVVPGGLSVGYSGTAAVEVGDGAAAHFEDATPLPIGSPGVPPTVAAPTRSAWAENLLILRVRGRAAWVVEPQCVAYINGATW
jgi:hypothetical protein